jgi:hypothetical protein
MSSENTKTQTCRVAHDVPLWIRRLYCGSVPTPSGCTCEIDTETCQYRHALPYWIRLRLSETQGSSCTCGQEANEEANEKEEKDEEYNH